MHFRRRLIIPRSYVARMASSLESGRNAFFQSAGLEFDRSKADASVRHPFTFQTNFYTLTVSVISFRQRTR